MALKLYPIGMQTFSEIREKDMLYVDKTEYVYRMSHGSGKFFFLSRPRRFGKSLLLSTMKSYFEGRKELFHGLAMERLETEWMEYPVLHFSMAGGKHMDKDTLEQFIGNRLEDEELRFGITEHSEHNNIRLMNLVKTAYEKTGNPVVVLIDEYDAPLLDVVHEDEQLPALRYVMRNFFSPLKDCDPYLRFVFLTGITKFSQLSIFSELNNIINISMDTRYDGICGITKDELLNCMSEDIDNLAERLHLTREQTIESLTQQYDGYHFTWPSSDVFNPYSLLCCFDGGRLGSYWFGSGTPTYLIEMMRKFKLKPAKIENMRADSASFDAPTERMTSIVPLLYQSGYLTIKDYDKEIDIYTLDIPNNEIRVGLYNSLLSNYLGEEAVEGRVVIAEMSRGINSGDIEGALELLQTFLETVPYCDNTAYEGHYQQLMYVIFSLLTPYRITVEQRTSRGRTDITLETERYVYIMELKFSKSADEALTQIDERKYAEAFALSGKEVVKVGINFDVAGEHNIVEWKVS